MILARVRVQTPFGSLLLYFSQVHNPRGGAELLVVAVGLLVSLVIALEQRNAGIELKSQMLRQPDLLVYTGTFKNEPCAFVEAGQNPTARDRPPGFHVHFSELELSLVDPQAAMKPGKYFGVFQVCLEFWPGLTGDDPIVPPSKHFASDQLKVVGVRHFPHKFAVFLPLLFFFRLPFRTLVRQLAFSFGS